jgi:murein DD-endopeptidase MepM/ murein hydrolase activator NlpD
MYAHLAEPSPLNTGDATACHLHFEIWTAPGWYEGGSPIDPLPYLEKWDAYS